jgi:translocation and assembly module TamB
VKALKITAITLVTLLLLVMLLLAYLTMTHGGMQRLFALGTSYVQGELRWSELQGSLVGPALITGLAYNGDDGTVVRIDNVNFDWHPRRLLHRQVAIETLSAEGIEVRLPPPAESEPSTNKEPFQLSDLSLPVGADIKELSLSDIRIYPHGSDEPIVVERVFFGGSGQQSDLQVVELSARMPEGEVVIDGMVNTTDNWPLDLTAAWQYRDTPVGELSGQANITGNLDELAVKHELQGAVTASTDLTVTDVINEITLAGTTTVNADDLGVIDPALDAVPLQLQTELSGQLTDLNVDATVNSNHPAVGPFTLDVSASTDQQVLDINDLNLSFADAVATIAAQGQIDLTTQEADVDVRWSDLSWPLQGDALISDAAGKLNIVGGASGVVVKGDATLSQSQAGDMELTIDVAADPSEVIINALSIGGAGTDTRLDTSGTFSIADNRIDLQGNWANLQWPLEGTADYGSDSGEFRVEGPLDDYQLELSLNAGGAQIPSGDWTIRGNGSQQALQSLSVEGNTLEGVITANGSAGWSPQPQWDMTIDAKGINPEQQWPGFDARVDVSIASSGQLTDEGLVQDTEIVDIGGTYRGQPLDGGGGVTMVDGELVVENLRLAAGDANITATGTIGSEVNLEWQVEAPALDKLIPGFNGELQLKGDHSGPADSPGSRMVIESAQIDTGSVIINDLDGTATVDLSGKQASVVELRASDINLSGQQWNDLRVDINGKPQSHRIVASIAGDQGNFNVAAEGAYEGSQWNGTLTDLAALGTLVGDWRLDQSVPVVAGAESVQIENLCLSSDGSALCAAVQRNADSSLNAAVALNEFDMAVLSDFLPPELGIDVALGGEVTVMIDQSGQLRVNAEAGFPDGNLTYEGETGPIEKAIGPTRITANVIDNRIDSAASIDLTDLGFINLESSLTNLIGATNESATPQIDGRLDSEINDLSIIGALVPSLESVTGVFNSKLAFNGALDSPRITGNAAVGDLSLEVPSVALQITDGTMQVTGNGRGGLLLRGEAQSGEGRLDLDGNYNPNTGALDLGVAGENFRVSNTNRQQVDISPDLNIRFADQKLSVTGELLVPTALIGTGGGGTELVTESPDVVVVDSTEVRTEKEESDLELDVQVTLGDNIRIDAGQFDGVLSGGLTVGKKPGQAITGSGAIEVVSGDFIVYGQTLTMERGRVLFSGGPIDDPVLDLDVARDVPEYDVKAGVTVSGSAQAPILELNSEPPQTDANTLSFILLGKPVDALGASYTLGRYITPDIYVSYGFDLFDRRDTFTLRYQLSNRLALIGTQSDTSGADLIYTLER